MPLLGSYLLQIIKSFKMISDDCIFKVQIILKMKNLQWALRNACTFRENHFQNSILCKHIKIVYNGMWMHFNIPVLCFCYFLHC